MPISSLHLSLGKHMPYLYVITEVSGFPLSGKVLGCAESSLRSTIRCTIGKARDLDYRLWKLERLEPASEIRLHWSMYVERPEAVLAWARYALEQRGYEKVDSWYGIAPAEAADIMLNATQHEPEAGVPAVYPPAPAKPESTPRKPKEVTEAQIAKVAIRAHNRARMTNPQGSGAIQGLGAFPGAAERAQAKFAQRARMLELALATKQD